MDEALICGHHQWLVGRERVCTREEGHEPPHEDDGSWWFEVDGVDDHPVSDSFDAYVAEHNIPVQQYAEAFKQWLGHYTGKDYKYQKVEGPFERYRRYLYRRFRGT